MRWQAAVPAPRNKRPTAHSLAILSRRTRACRTGEVGLVERRSDSGRLGGRLNGATNIVRAGTQTQEAGAMGPAKIDGTGALLHTLVRGSGSERNAHSPPCAITPATSSTPTRRDSTSAAASPPASRLVGRPSSSPPSMSWLPGTLWKASRIRARAASRPIASSKKRRAAAGATPAAVSPVSTCEGTITHRAPQQTAKRMTKARPEETTSSEASVATPRASVAPLAL